MPHAAPHELREWLIRKWGIAKKAAEWIALGTCGNVREALLQASSYRDFGILPEIRQIKTEKCASRSEAAKRAWETMRQKAA